jgi:hypothetical protein
LKRSRSKAGQLKRAGVPVAMALSVWLHPSFGAEWSATPRLNVSTEVNSNIRLTTIDHDTVFGLIPEVGVVLKRATEINTLEFEPSASVPRYWGEDNLNYEAYGLRFGARHRLERLEFGLDANYRRDSTLATELETTGRVQRQLAVDTVRVGPSLSYLVTERDRVDIGYDYNRVTYEEAVASGLSDYTYQVADATYTHDLSEKAKGFATFSYSRFDVDDNLNPIIDPLNTIDSSSTTDAYALIGGFQGQNERASGGAYGGLRYSVVTSESLLRQAQSDSGFGSLFGFSAAYQFLDGRMVWNGGFDRSVDPSGDGTEVARDQWRTGLSHKFTDRLSANLGFRYLTSSTAQILRNDRTYLAGDASLRYFLDPYWSVVARYQHAEQSFDSITDNTADQDLVSVGLSYSGRKWSVSR